MKTLPPPPESWKVQPITPYGGTAKHFKGVPTGRLVRELQKHWLESDDYKFKLRQSGKYSRHEFLIALHERADRSVFNAAVSLISNQRRRQKIQGLTILREMGPWGKRPIFPETWDLLERRAAQERDPIVLQWVLGCLGWTGKKRAFPTLLRFARHPHAWVRYSVASNIVSCAPDVKNPAVSEALILLCNDKSSSVRWNALYEVKEYLNRNTPAIREMLKRRRKDSNKHVRKLAKEALESQRKRQRSVRGQLTNG